jgi:predicted amidohydrolase YtcJ
MSAYTAGTARVLHHDDTTGHLAEGSLADLVVLDTDPFNGATENIGSTAVRRTYVEGELVFSRDD